MLHRIDEIEQLPGPRFFAYCYRLTVYQGVIANAWRRQQAKRIQQRAAGPVSLTDWARAHPEAMRAAQRMRTSTEGGDE